jgi:hypothetical protein
MSVFPGSKPAELKERFYQYLYFSGATEQTLRELLAAKNHLAFVAYLVMSARSLLSRMLSHG